MANTRFDFVAQTVTDGITALAGGGQTNATQLAFGNNAVTTVATAADSVKLPYGQAPTANGQDNRGSIAFVFNMGAAALAVFPQTGGAIATGAANAAFSVPVGKGASFVLLRQQGFGGYTTNLWGVNLSA